MIAKRMLSLRETVSLIHANIFFLKLIEKVNIANYVVVYMPLAMYVL